MTENNITETNNKPQEKSSQEMSIPPQTKEVSSNATLPSKETAPQETAGTNTTSVKQVEETNIFILMENSRKSFSENNAPFILLYNNIQETKLLLDASLKALKKVDDKLKSMKKVDKRLGKKHSVSTDDRKMLKLYRKHEKKQIVNLREKLDMLRRQYRNRFASEMEDLDLATMRSKADSKFYVQQGKSVFLGKARKLINDVLKEGRKDEIIMLRNLAFETSDEGVKLFGSSLRDFFYSEDKEVFILCGGVIKDKLHKAMRKSLIAWDPDSDAEIPELVIIEDDPITTGESPAQRVAAPPVKADSTTAVEQKDPVQMLEEPN